MYIYSHIIVNDIVKHYTPFHLYSTLNCSKREGIARESHAFSHSPYYLQMKNCKLSDILLTSYVLFLDIGLMSKCTKNILLRSKDPLL